MKSLLILAATGMMLAGSAQVPPSPELLAIRNVYLMPMRGGFDQYLANEIVRTGLMRVVTDPKKADAVFTDRIGQAFEQKLDDLNPPVKAPAASLPLTPPATDEPKSAAKLDDSSAPEIKASDIKPPDTKPDDVKHTAADAANSKSKALSGLADAMDASASSRPVSSLSSGRGNVFLVARQSRSVVWSTFREPRSRQPKDLKRAADSVATDLKHALQPLQPESK